MPCAASHCRCPHLSPHPQPTCCKDHVVFDQRAATHNDELGLADVGVGVLGEKGDRPGEHAGGRPCAGGKVAHMKPLFTPPDHPTHKMQRRLRREPHAVHC